MGQDDGRQRGAPKGTREVPVMRRDAPLLAMTVNSREAFLSRRRDPESGADPLDQSGRRHAEDGSLRGFSLSLSHNPPPNIRSLSLPLFPSLSLIHTHARTRTHILRPPLSSSRPPTAGAMPAHSDSRRRDPSLIATRRRSRFNRLHKTGERLALNSGGDPR